MKFGVKIPRKAICPTHQPPFDFIYDAFMEKESLIVALANRTGGKTMAFAILAILDSLANDDCEGANLGAIERQAIRCYGYIKRFIEHQPDFLNMVKGNVTLGKTEFKNNSWLQVLVATMSGVNSPHPQRLKMDEVELINWTIIQEALSMPVSKENIKAVTVLGSTRKFSHGPMQKLIDNNDAKLYQWCIWECMEAWPTDLNTSEEIKSRIMHKFGNLNILPEKLSELDGYYKWYDLLDKLKGMDEDIFRTQWMCERPDSTGLIYPRFDDQLNTIRDFQLDPTKQLYIFEDIGYAKDHPDAVLFCQVDVVRMELIIFDELYLTMMDDKDIVCEVVKKLAQWGLCELDPTENLQEIDNFSKYLKKIRGWVPDYHPLTLVANRKRLGLPILDKVTTEDDGIEDAAKLYLLEVGIPHVRSFIDDRRIKITPNIVELRRELMTYQKKRLLDGTWKDEPEKKNDHGCFCPHTQVLTQRGTLAIIDVTTNDKVWTPLGWSKVLKVANMGKKEVVNFHGTKATKDHPILTPDGFLPLSDLIETDRLWNMSISSDDLTGATRIHQTFPIKSISGVVKRKTEVAQADFIQMYGNTIMGKFPKVSMSIIKAVTTIIAILKILKYTLLPIMLRNMQSLLENLELRIRIILNWQDKKLLTGTNRKQGMNIINGLAVSRGSVEERSYLSARTAMDKQKPISASKQSSVASIVKCQCSGSVEVHNLATDTGMFIANNVLVSNCDALRYGTIRLWPNLYYGGFAGDLGKKQGGDIIRTPTMTGGIWAKRF